MEIGAQSYTVHSFCQNEKYDGQMTGNAGFCEV